MRAISAFFLLLLFFPSAATAVEPSFPVQQVQDGRVLVSTNLGPLPEKIRKEIQSGLPKEVEYQIDLMREWDRWMDEYMDGQTVVRTVKYDVLKKEYRMSSLEGRYLYEKTGSDLNEAVRWLTVISDIPVARVETLLPGPYYVTVTMTFRRMKMTGPFSVLMFFMSESEYSVAQTGAPFTLPP